MSLAGNYGSRKRSGGVSTLICAVLDDRRPNDDDEVKYMLSSSLLTHYFHLIINAGTAPSSV
jgi:hypothetical protein